MANCKDFAKMGTSTDMAIMKGIYFEARTRHFMATPKFYLDSHISTEVAVQLRNKGVDIIHCSEVGMPDESDYNHLVYATAHQRILVTCDAGIEWQLHYTWLAEGKSHAGIVYFRGEDQCKSMSVIIRELLFLVEVADYEQDLYNQFWRASE